MEHFKTKPNRELKAGPEESDDQIDTKMRPNVKVISIEPNDDGFFVATPLPIEQAQLAL